MKPQSSPSPFLPFKIENPNNGEVIVLLTEKLEFGADWAALEKIAIEVRLRGNVATPWEALAIAFLLARNSK